jgi:hypothetical protein
LRVFCGLLSVPVEKTALAGDFLLKLENTVDKGLGGRRAARHVNINRDDTVATTNNGLPTRV